MSEALGIDLRVAACAAARWRHGVVEPCVLGEDGSVEVPTVELEAEAGGNPTQVVDAVEATRATLVDVAERALGDVAADAVGVAYALTPDDGPRRLVEQAAAAAFGSAYLVPRPVAALARFVHAGGAAGGDVAVLDMDGDDVEISVVRRGRDGYDVLGTSRVSAPPSDPVDMASHLNDAVTAFESLLAGAVGGNAGVRAVLAVGRTEWLDQLAVQVRVATGLEVAVDPEPAVAAAIGAAVLAAGPDTRGRSQIAGPAAVVVPAAVPVAQSLTSSGPEAGAEAGATVGDAVAGSGEAGSGVGGALHDAASGVGDGRLGDAVGEAVGDGLAGKDGLAGPDGLPRLKDVPDDGKIGDSVGDAAGRAVGDGLADVASRPGAGGLAGAAVGAGAGAARRSRRRRAAVGAGAGAARRGRRRRAAVGAGAAMAALLVVAGALAAFGDGAGRAGGTDDVATGGGGRTATSRERSGSSSNSERDATTTTVAGEPVTTGVDGTPRDAVPSRAGSPTSVTGPGTPRASGPSGAPSDASAPATPDGDDPPATTAPTAPADTAGPSVSGLARSTGVINENGFEFCEAPFASEVSATVTDPSGVTSVVVTWSGNGDSGSAAMTQSGSAWSATVGPVADNAGLAYGQSTTISWTVTALDAAGNATSITGPSITVEGC